jgi:hypothetical protein
MRLGFMERILLCHITLLPWCVSHVPLLYVVIDRNNSVDPYGLLAIGRFMRWSLCALLNALFRDGLDVMIKVISCKDEGANEVNILKYLSSEPVVSEADNPSVPLLEILHHDDWVFSIQPRWSSSVEPEFQNVSDGLNFCIQVTRVMLFY